jgi:hypothetical protein
MTWSWRPALPSARQNGLRRVEKERTIPHCTLRSELLSTQRPTSFHGAGGPARLEKRLPQCRSVYWDARQKYANYLLLTTWNCGGCSCDPVITGRTTRSSSNIFADESSYGCLRIAPDMANQTRRSWAPRTWIIPRNLFHHFNRSGPIVRLGSASIRRFRGCHPGSADYREEDRFADWLAARFHADSVSDGPAPMRKVISREAVY